MFLSFIFVMKNFLSFIFLKENRQRKEQKSRYVIYIKCLIKEHTDPGCTYTLWLIFTFNIRSLTRFWPQSNPIHGLFKFSWPSV